MKCEYKYGDIINLPHPVSARRAGMSMVDRGAQFSPFAALTGFDAAIEETARLTDCRIELTEGEQAALNEKLCLLAEDTGIKPEITVTFFRPDARKSGGAYISVTSRVKKIDAYAGALIMADGMAVAFEDIIGLEWE